MLAGGRRLSAGEYVWVNQQASFVWYTGAPGSYPDDRAYGCDQADLGHGGYPGTVTLVVENEYQHCSASFAGIAPGGQARSGAPATCALGGYSIGASTLPVPASLITLYRRFDAEVNGLILQARQHTITTATLAAALESIRGQQQSAFARLFPPVWGCSFDGLFDGVSVAKASLDAQTAQLATGSRPSPASLAGDRIDLQSLARGLAACQATATSSGGAPRAVVRAVQRLLTEVSGLGGARSGARGLAYLRAHLPAIDSGLDSVVSRSFPTVYGMRYIDLVERTLTVRDPGRAGGAGGRGR